MRYPKISEFAPSYTPLKVPKKNADAAHVADSDFAVRPAERLERKRILLQ